MRNLLYYSSPRTKNQRTDAPMLVPAYLYKKVILQEIRDIISIYDISDFDHCDDADKDKLTALGLQAADCDIEIVLSKTINEHLAKYLLSYDPDDRIEFLRVAIQEAHEQFAPYFNELFTQLRKQHDEGLHKGN